jgi:hypothetical protein
LNNFVKEIWKKNEVFYENSSKSLVLLESLSQVGFLISNFVNFRAKAWKILGWTSFSHEKLIQNLK